MFDMLCVDTFYLFICQDRTCAPLYLWHRYCLSMNVGTNNSLTPSQTFPSLSRSDEIMMATGGLESLQSISGQIISVTLIWQSK